MEVIRTEAEKGLIEMSEAPKLQGAAWISDLQEKARAEFLALGLPHRRVEEWKYTDLKTALKTVFPLVSERHDVSVEALNNALGNELSQLDAYKLVIVDGQFDKDLSDQTYGDDVEIVALNNELTALPTWLKRIGQITKSERDAVQALNLALMQGGVAVRIADKCDLDKPLHLIFVNSSDVASSFASRLFFDIGSAAKIELIESHVSLSKEPVQTNVVTELCVGNWAHVRHVKFTEDNSESVHLANVIGTLGKEADYGFFNFTVNGGMTRNQIEMRYEGDDAKADISGAALLTGSSHADMTLVMDHGAEGCESRELFKVVLDETSRAVFQGKVIVQPGAQKTDGEMMSKALLLSESAEFDSKPELEIYADDVLCGHGATTGQIDEDLLFYLKARGITDAEARALLIQAFIGEAIELVENDTVREMLINRSVAWYKKT